MQVQVALENVQVSPLGRLTEKVYLLDVYVAEVRGVSVNARCLELDVGVSVAWVVKLRPCGKE